jgi:hypothetical protein
MYRLWTARGPRRPYDERRAQHDVGRTPRAWSDTTLPGHRGVA